MDRAVRVLDKTGVSQQVLVSAILTLPRYMRIGAPRRTQDTNG